MKALNRVLLIAAVAVFCAASFGVLVSKSAYATSGQCLGSPTFAFGRKKWCGYFNNNFFTYGDNVRIGGIPYNVDTANEFISLVVGDLHSGNAQRRTGAQFLILTMLGREPGSPKSVTETGTGTANQLATWEASVRSYANQSENGVNQSRGDNGRIDWHVWEHMPCGTMNTYYQVAQDDVAPFANNTGNSDCGNASSKEEFVLFRDKNGNVIYRIRRACMNPMGTLNPLAKPQPNKYDLTPSITPTVDGKPISGGGVEAGQTVQFSYGVRNSGSDPSPSANCMIYANVHNGNFATRSNPTPGGKPGQATGCPRVFGANSFTSLTSENVLAAANQTICRSLFVSPATATVASRGVEACVPVISKPYFKVYGGDISAGNGWETALGTNMCTSNTEAAIIGWNRGAGGGYGGAGAQFAEFALSEVFESASAVGNGGSGTAPVPSGLAFAGTGTSGSVYGGSFGALPCIRDYYAGLPSDPKPFASLDAAKTSGAYSWKGGRLNLSGQLPAGKRVTLYVDGDVFIDGEIAYPAAWTSGDMPLFQLIVEGNIYIKNNVSRIDGVFVAQKGRSGGGTIYTCALSATPMVADGSLYKHCNGKLTINGAFVANDVQFLRTNGTKHLGSGSEPNGSGNIAEVFNFSPALWMAQPVDPALAPAKYDSITSLPPIL